MAFEKVVFCRDFHCFTHLLQYSTRQQNFQQRNHAVSLADACSFRMCKIAKSAEVAYAAAA